MLSMEPSGLSPRSLRASPAAGRILCLFLVLLLVIVPSLQGSRIKDLAIVEGGRDNQLVGYGLVVGLAGEGDSRLSYTVQSVANALQRFGVNVPPETIRGDNVAAVMVTAEIPAFSKPGSRIDVTVSSIGDAETLQGGVLLQTPLLGADETVYAVAQGGVVIGGFTGGSSGGGGATVTKNHPTVGSIPGGAIVEREIRAEIVRNQTMRLLLLNPDFTSAARMAEAINRHFPGSSRAADSSTVSVIVPEEFLEEQVHFVAMIEAITVKPDLAARVVINERTGTIVATSKVQVSSVAISHGSLTISIVSDLEVSQPPPLSDAGATVVVPSTTVDVVEQQGGFKVLREEPTIEQVAAALNSLGVTTREMMSIFQAMKAAGALQAELVIQ